MSIYKLYDQVIRQHNATPYHFKKPEHAAPAITSNSPVCGDKFEIFISLHDLVIHEIYFYGFGCAVSKAATSVLAQTLEGKTVSQANALVTKFLAHLNGSGKSFVDVPPEFSAFETVRDFPARYDCAALPWLETQKFLMNLSGKTAS